MNAVEKMARRPRPSDHRADVVGLSRPLPGKPSAAGSWIA